MMNINRPYRQVLEIPGFPSFLWTQFLNAFNDNSYKIAVSLLAAHIGVRTVARGDAVSMAGFLFALPFLLFCSYAGQLADRFAKQKVFVMTKGLEIVAMALATAAMMSGKVHWMMAVLFLTATQAAFFSPAKYGLVPEMAGGVHLSAANGLLEMSTFVAIILGTLFGSGMIAGFHNRVWVVGAALIAVAVAGMVTSLRIGPARRPAVKRKFDWNPMGGIMEGMRAIKGDRALWLSTLGTSYFWFLGALFQMLLILYAKDSLHAGEAQSGALMASLALGIGVGSLAAGRFSGGRITPGLVPVGALGMAAGSFVLAFACHSVAAAAPALFATGVMAGLFVVPLNAILQDRPEEGERGRVLASANMVNTVGVLLASGVVKILHVEMGLSAAQLIGVSGVMTVLIAAAGMLAAPQLTLRFLLWVLTRLIYRIRVTGAENVPLHGGTLLVANHVTYVDGFVVNASTHRMVRFMVGEHWYDRFRPFFEHVRAIRVPMGSKRGAVEAICAARKELEAGHVVCIFAEGALTLNGNIAEFKRGLERIVAGLDVPVIPVHLGGMWTSIFSRNPKATLWRSLRQRPFRVQVAFGHPVQEVTAQAVRNAVLELSAENAALAIDPEETLARLLVRSARRRWTAPCMTELEGRDLSYGDVLTAAVLVGDILPKAETRVGIMLPASTASAVMNVGAVLTGKVPTNLNFTVGPDALEAAISSCGLRTIYTSRKLLEKTKIAPRAEMVFVEDALKFGRLRKIKAYARARFAPTGTLVAKGVRSDSVAAILFSSGSSAAPKGIMLSHANLIANVNSVEQLFPLERRDVVASALPHFHSFGFTFTLWFPLLNGARTAYHPQPLDAKSIGELIARTRATILPTAPTFCQAYLRGCTKEQLSSLRFVMTGAERLPAALANAFEEKFGVKVLEGYGATEMAPVIAVNVPDRSAGVNSQLGMRLGTVGQPVPGVAVKVTDPETGLEVPAGSEGLLVVRGPNRMMGYWNDPDATQRALRDGWYVTGDIATLDAQGFIRIVDRQSRFSKIAGEMAPHGKVEEALRRVVRDASVVVTGVVDDRKGERLVAFVADPSTCPASVWKGLMASGLPKLWIPKRDDIRIVDAIPMLGSGKVDFRALRAMAA
jgi:acyl-[acyl-carrier-protein]-phospholipid O-acyltransferase / long-chain-fatty-acid--[acyl-carrier-protein] ligase